MRGQEMFAELNSGRFNNKKLGAEHGWLHMIRFEGVLNPD